MSTSVSFLPSKGDSSRIVESEQLGQTFGATYCCSANAFLPSFHSKAEIFRSLYQRYYHSSFEAWATARGVTHCLVKPRKCSCGSVGTPQESQKKPSSNVPDNQHASCFFQLFFFLSFFLLAEAPLTVWRLAIRTHSTAKAFPPARSAHPHLQGRDRISPLNRTKAEI